MKRPSNEAIHNTAVIICAGMVLGTTCSGFAAYRKFWTYWVIMGICIAWTTAMVILNLKILKTGKEVGSTLKEMRDFRESVEFYESLGVIESKLKKDNEEEEE